MGDLVNKYQNIEGFHLGFTTVTKSLCINSKSMFPNPIYINYESSLSKKRVVPKQNESISCTKNVSPHKNTYTEKFPKCYFAKKKFVRQLSQVFG